MIIANKEIAVKRSSLNLIKVPERDSKTWKGIGHGVLATALVKGVEKAGLTITNEEWYVSPKKKTVLWGALDIKADDAMPELNLGQDASFSLGVRHGNMGEYAVSFAVGARVAVCSNGMFLGDFVSKKRHTQSLDLPAMIDDAIAAYIEKSRDLSGLINAWRETEIDDKTASYLILQSHARGYVNFRYLEHIDKHWTSPPHEEFAPRTAWSLYNAFTETAKILTPPRQVRLLTGLRKMYDMEFGVGDAYLGPQTL